LSSGGKRSSQTVGLPMPPAKKRKLHVVKPSFDVIYADFLLKLEGATYFLYGENSDGTPVIRVQDCSYHVNSPAFKNSQHDNFVPRAVKFSPQQWDDMMASMDDIAKAIEDDISSRLHIGGNTFVTVKPERALIDIREYFLPDNDSRCVDVAPEEFFGDLVPTRRGVSLTENAWKMLVIKADQLLKDFTASTVAWKGECGLSHADDEMMLKCHHCNPNGHQFWTRG